ncbi:MAG TPA: VTT domain-containing protein [Polyangiaceae bacterium]|nr:VTT domain-containing protein [Polyangiaceae bacterium]
MGLGLVAVLLLVVLLARTLRPEVEHLGQALVHHGGYFGMAIGSLLADGFHFPIPPQFYMLLAIASATPMVWTLASISLGSISGGILGYLIARRLGRIRWLEERFQKRLEARGIRLGTKGLFMLALSPIAFSWVIYFCGVSGYAWRHVALVCSLRVPKLLLYFWLMRAGWEL